MRTVIPERIRKDTAGTVRKIDAANHIQWALEIEIRKGGIVLICIIAFGNCNISWVCTDAPPIDSRIKIIWLRKLPVVRINFDSAARQAAHDFYAAHLRLDPYQRKSRWLGWVCQY